MKRFIGSLIVVLVCCSGAAFCSETPQKYIVKFKDDLSFAGSRGHEQVVKGLQQQLEKNLNFINKSTKIKVDSKLWIINAVVSKMTKDEVKNLSVLKNIEEIRPVVYKRYIDKDIDKHVVRADPGTIQWSIQKVNAPEVWKNLKIDGTGIVVGHIDTGIDASHPYLKGKTIGWKDFTPAAKPEPYDDQGHGTHTAGSIAGTNGVGVAPGAKLIVAKVFDSQGSADDSVLLLAMQWMMDPDGNPETNDAPKLVSNSWGDDDSTSKSLWDAVQAWVNAGMLPVFAAGNNGPSGKVGTPGGYPHSWAVAATTNKDSLAYFSSIGPVSWSDVVYVKPDIAAPGQGVISCAVGGGLVSNSGTSMACPHVAGLAALMLQANPKLTIEKIREIAEATALDLGTAGKDNKFGSGRFNALACISKVLESTTPSSVFQAYEATLMTEKALIGIQPESPLAAPLAKSIIMRSMNLDDGEFATLQKEVMENCGESGKALLKETATARQAEQLQK